MDLKDLRRKLKISQTRLAQMSEVSRFKIALYELGEGTLSADECSRIVEALRSEARRIQEETLDIARGQFQGPPSGAAA
jgi:predicted transcriptional regulator